MRSRSVWTTALLAAGLAAASCRAQTQLRRPSGYSRHDSEAADRPAAAPAAVSSRLIQASTAGAAPAPQEAREDQPQDRQDKQDKLVITGRVAVVAEDVAALVAGVRARVTAQGGTIAQESLSAAGSNSPHAHMSLRLPPRGTENFLGWLATQARIEERRIDSEDVSRAYFDQQLAIKNLELTAQRLQELLTSRTGSLPDVLQVESELTRVRGELEQVKGAQRYLEDRIGRATLEVSIASRPGTTIVAAVPEQKFQLVPSFDVLSFVDRRDQHRTRLGGGVALLFSRRFALELKLFPARGDDDRSVLVNLATAVYSDFLGGGRRRFGNPYLGLTIGGGNVNDRATFAAGADVGLELVRTRWLLVDLRGRAQWLAADEVHQLALSGIFGLGVPF